MEAINDKVSVNAAPNSATQNESRKSLLAAIDDYKESAGAVAADRSMAQPKDLPNANAAGYIPPYILESMAASGLYSAPATDSSSVGAKKSEQAFTPRESESANGEREVYDAKLGYANPGSRARFEGDPVYGNADVDRIYDYTGFVRDFYKNEFGLNSIDGHGMKVVSTANYGENYQNAFWDGKQMYYGHPSEGSPFKTFVILDVTGHELTHGVTEGQVKGMWHWNQAGALDEHFSDAFGAMVEQYAKHQTATDADWILGKGAFKDDVHAKGIRDMLHPGTAFDDPRIGKDPQPASMKDYYSGSKDNWGVHINSGIPNRAFALFAQSVGGFSWKDPGHIWFEARKHIGVNPTFGQFAFQTIEQAKKLGTPDEVDKLQKAWDAVGVTPDSSPPKT